MTTQVWISFFFCLVVLHERLGQLYGEQEIVDGVESSLSQACGQLCDCKIMSIFSNVYLYKL